MNILITSAGQRVSLVKAFQNELKKVFPNGKVFAVDMNPDLSPACIVSDGYQVIQSVLDNDYVESLIEICKRKDVKLVLPTIDTELLILAKSKHLFIAANIHVIVSNEKFIKMCRDKRLTNKFFIEKGINVPEPIDKSNPVFPLFIKPHDGSLSKDVFLIKKQEELTDYHFSNEKLMFMEYVDPQYFDEYTIDAYYDKSHKLKCAVPRKRIAVRSGEISKGLTSKNYLVDYLEEKLLTIEGAIGCMTIQFFYNKMTNSVIGIEINPRFGGGYPLSYLAGANYPLWLIKEYLLDESIGFMKDWEDNLLMLRYDDEVIVHNYEK